MNIPRRAPSHQYVQILAKVYKSSPKCAKLQIPRHSETKIQFSDPRNSHIPPARPDCLGKIPTGPPDSGVSSLAGLFWDLQLSKAKF